MRVKRVYKGFRRPLFWFLSRRLFTAKESFTVVYIVNFINCVYRTKDPKNQGDWNKLCGISSEFVPDHFSFRFGWRWNINRSCIEVCHYCYINGKRTISNIRTLEQKIDYALVIHYNHTTKEVEMTIANYDRQIYKNADNKLYFKENGMYIGGDERANRTIKYKLKRFFNHG